MHKLICFIITCLISTQALALPINGRIKSNADYSGYKIYAFRTNGQLIDSDQLDDDNRFSLSVASQYYLALVDIDNKFAGSVVVKCSGLAKVSGCNTTSSKLYNLFNKKRATLRLTPNSTLGFFTANLSTANQATLISKRSSVRATSFRPAGNRNNLGLNKGVISNNATIFDRDRDGLFSVFDIDEDGDGILDAYDTDNFSVSSVGSKEFKVFSNLKLNIEFSLNANTGSVPSDSLIDSVLQNASTLAIEVVQDSESGGTTEIDGGSLSYLATGGSGNVMGSGPFPDNFDSDVDGYGEITEGPSGDFQLSHGATSSEIGAGDTFEEVITDALNVETRVPGMINFIFYTTPAIKEIEISDGSTVFGSNTITYPATSGMLGSATNCIQAPATGDVYATITAWRPQRPGISSLGEASFVDLGNNLFTIDIPNLPCVQSGAGCSGSGPGNAPESSYSTADSNLSVEASGLRDSFGDHDANSTNTFTFTVNLSDALGVNSWASGESLFIDLQARSENGDNAAQKFCIERE